MVRLVSANARCLVLSGALLSSTLAAGCGRILLEQLPEPATAGGPDATIVDPDDELDAADDPDAEPSELDAASADDGSTDAQASDDAQLAGDAGLNDAALDATLPSDAAADATADAALDAGAMCSLSGTWAAQLDVPLSWPGPVLAAGSGTLRVWGRAQVTHTGNSVQLAFVPCNVLVPDFALNPAVANETYGVSYPLALFDRTPSPFASSSATGPITGALPGGSIALSGLSVLMGVTMANPLTDGWPTVGSVMQVDTDTNGKPAISASYKTGGAYRFPSVNAGQTARSDIAYLAARMNFTSALTMSSCNAGMGSANVTTFDTHIVGCRVTGSSADCTTAERDFIDAARPAHAAGAASIRLSRVANNATCAAVRSALP